MELAHRWADRNLTRLELVAACIILSLLIGYALRHMLVFFAGVERTMLNTSIVNINSALKFHAAIASMRGDKNSLADLSEQSPFRFVQSMQGLSMQPGDNIQNSLNLRATAINPTPANYAGELFTPDLSTIEPGTWYFDLFDKTLNYRVRNAEFFQSDRGDVPIIKLRVVVDYNDADANNRFDPDIDEFQSVQLQTVGTYYWVEADQDTPLDL